MQIQKKKTIFKGYYELKKVFLSKGDDSPLFEREQFVTPNSIGALVYVPGEKQIILVKQFRVGPEQPLLEIVAGKLENSDENEVKTLEREVMEETGYEIKQSKLIHQFYTCPGPVTEKMKLYFVEAGGGLASENEEIEVIRLEVEDFLNAKFIDAKSIIAQQWFKLNLEYLV